MQCQCIKQFGEPLTLEERTDLSPQGSEVILKVVAAGVCHTDVHLRSGGYDIGHGERLDFAKRGFKLPLTLGHETVGVIEAAGPEAGDVTTGETCVVFPWVGCGDCAVCAEGKENYCLAPRFLGVFQDGGYASHIRVPHPRCLFPIGDVPPATAAPYACSGMTTYSALKKVSDVTKAAPIVLYGAGGLGQTCMSILKAMGGPAPVVVDIDPAKRDQALEAGASAAIDGAEENAIAQVQEAAGGPVAAAIDFVANEQTTELAFESAAKGGKIILVGLYGGAAPWKLPMIPIKAINIMGSYMGNIAEFRELMEIVRSCNLAPIPVAEFPLAQANEALDQLEEGKIAGRAILTP